MLSVTHNGHRYVARLSFDERERVSRALFNWDEEQKHWFTLSAQTAYRLFNYCDEPTKEIIRKNLGLELMSHGPLDWPESKIPFAHQIEGAIFALTRRASYLAFDPGLGKTATAALCINAEPEGKVLLICPSFLKYTWLKELNEWLTVKKRIQLINQERTEPDPEAEIYIMPDSLLACHVLRERFFAMGIRFTWLFIDEAHRYGNDGAKRTKSLFGSMQVKVSHIKGYVVWKGFHRISNRVVDLSGTPMRNRPMELWAIANAHARHAIQFLNKHLFGVKFCGGFEGEWGWDYSGATNTEELRDSLREHWMLVKHKKDCMDLPEKLPAQFIFLDKNTQSKKIHTQEMDLLSKVSLPLIIKRATEESAAFKDKFEARQSDKSFQFISDLRKISGMQKVKPVADIIPELIELDGPLIVFAWHDEVIQALAVRLAKYNPFVVTGSTSPKRRFEIQEEFQSSKTRDLVIGNIQAMGVGFTFTRSSVALIVEPSWVPSENNQAIDRVHRITQEWDVKSYYAVWENSLDHLVLNAHLAKEEVTEAVIG